MTIAKILSSDSHVVEPPDLWATRLEPKFRERAPRVVQEDDGDWWIVDGQRTNSFQGGAQAGKRFEHHDEVKPAARFAEVRPGAYLPRHTWRTTKRTGSTAPSSTPRKAWRSTACRTATCSLPSFGSIMTGSRNFAGRLRSGSRALP